MTDEMLLALIGQIYDAALDPSQWSVFTRSLGEAFHGNSSLFFQDLKSAEVGVSEFVGDPAFAANYAAYYATCNPWLPKLAGAPAGTIATGEMVISRDAYERCEFYNDWMRPQDLYHGIGAILLKNEDVVTNLSVLRPLAAKPLTAAEQRQFRELMSHLQRALRVHRRIAGADLARHGLEHGLERLALGAVVVDAAGAIIFANGVAERLLRTGSGIMARHGRLRPQDPRRQGALDRIIAAAAGAKDPGDHDGTLTLPRETGRPLLLLACPLHGPAGGVEPWPPLALVFLSDPDHRAVVPVQALAQLYGLTPAEARLLAALLGGTRIGDYAGQAGITLNTVNTQLKQIFSKTGHNRQADLMRECYVNAALTLTAGTKNGRPPA